MKDKKTIFLIGFMGCGKTSVGRMLSRLTGLPFYDTDQMIVEQEKMSINEIFQTRGESFFRDLETQLLKSMEEHPFEGVISVGGGLPLREENRAIMKRIGMVVYLNADIETLLRRLKGDTTRPLLQGGDLREKIEALTAARKTYYEDAAVIQIITDNYSVRETAMRIAKHAGV